MEPRDRLFVQSASEHTLASGQIVQQPIAGATSTSPDLAIRIRNLKKNYGPIEAVRGVDLDIHVGEIFGLIGPDGAGKTSIFQILGGVMQASSGEAMMIGRPARAARAYGGYLTQVFSLY